MGYVEWPTAFDDAKGQVQQFTHGGTDDDHHGLTFVEQVFAEGLNHWVKTPSVYCGEVECFTQLTTTDFGQPTSALKRRTGQVLFGCQADESGQLSGTAKIGKRNLGQQLLSRDTTDSGDALEQLSIPLKRGMPVDVVVDGRLDRFDLLIQIRDHRLDRVLNRAVERSLEPVLLLLFEVFEVFEPSDQRLKLLDLRSQWQPGLGLLLETEAGDDEGILFVGLIATQAALGVMLDAPGIDDTNPVTFGHKKLGERHAITAGRLQTSVELLCTLLNQPRPQLLKASRGVGEDFVDTFALLVSEQHHVEASFTDINPEYHRASFLCSATPWVSLVHAGSRRCGPKIPSDLKKCGKGDLISFTGSVPRAMNRFILSQNSSVPEFVRVSPN